MASSSLKAQEIWLWQWDPNQHMLFLLQPRKHSSALSGLLYTCCHRDVSETPKVSLSRRDENKPRLFHRAPHHQKSRRFRYSLQLILGDMSKRSKSQLSQPDLPYTGSRQTAHPLTQHLQSASAACLGAVLVLPMGLSVVFTFWLSFHL